MKLAHVILAALLIMLLAQGVERSRASTIEQKWDHMIGVKWIGPASEEPRMRRAIEAAGNVWIERPGPQLSAFGSQGWELVTVTRIEQPDKPGYGGAINFFFKRPLK